MSPSKNTSTAYAPGSPARPVGRKRHSSGPVRIEFPDNDLTQLLCGEHDGHLILIEQELGITIAPRGNLISLSGPREAVEKARQALESLYQRLTHGLEIETGDVLASLRMTERNKSSDVVIRTQKRHISARTFHQESFLLSMQNHGLTFALGPAGTGKTYLAVAQGLSLLLAGAVERLILSRPAVEAGERLGFLPGDMREKVDPYLRPIYDALNDMLPGSQVMKYIADQNIEIAPLAFMRGRTLNRAFIILDEAQNATPMQMKMFLTRLGDNARMVVTGDLSQIDLPVGERSGLAEAAEILRDVDGVSTIIFDGNDVVRNSLVQRIVGAYDDYDARSQTGPGQSESFSGHQILRHDRSEKDPSQNILPHHGAMP